jgi:cell division protein FtsI (penicillin-binding protein 3)
MQLDLTRGTRTRTLAILTLVIMAVFVVRLFYLQVIRHEYYVAQANAEQVKALVIPAHRGEIYALDNGVPTPIVMNETVYTVFADPKIVNKPTEVAELIRRVAGGNARVDLEKLLDKKDSRYQILATKVTRKQAEMMKEKGLRGLGFQEESQRVYPEGQLAAQTLGFVNPDGQGQYGVEGALNERLSGKDGLLKTVTDVSSVPLTIGDKNVMTPADHGDNVVLTIDRNIQAYAEKALAAGLERSKATDGSVMIMDPQTGKIMAMANLPTYNPGEYYNAPNAAAYNNATVSVPYEPGSDVKVLTMAVGLDKNVVQPDSTYNNTDYIQVEDRTITNATKGQTGVITYQRALNYSLNTGFVTVAQRLGDGKSITFGARQTMYDYFHTKFGLGQVTGVEVSGEAAGTVISPEDSDGGAVRYSNMSFGQGLDVTMVQVCAAFSAVINGGTYYQPTVVGGVMDDDGVTFTPEAAKGVRQGVIQPGTSDKIRAMVHEARAAFYAGKDRGGYYTGGKTGTSQTIENGVYVDNQTVGTYLGFGGEDSSSTGPKYVIMVQVSGKGMNLTGSTDALPIFTDISNWMLQYMKLQPKG